MHVLIVHQGFPGQYKHIVHELHKRGDKISVISLKEPNPETLSCIDFYRYKVVRGNGKDTHNLSSETESKTIRGESVALIAEQLNDRGIAPDLILAHPGWGETLFLKTIWPNTPQLHYVEYAYGTEDSDSDFKDIFNRKLSWKDKAKIKMKNANVYLNLEEMDWGVTPTRYQLNTLPRWARSKTSVIHDGIDTDWAKPNPEVKIKLNDGTSLKYGDKIITFVNRTFEPYRGVHKMIAALPKILEECPDLTVFLIGKDTPYVSYGEHRCDNKGWLTYFREQYGDKIDWSRIYAPGKISHDNLKKLFQITSAHVYLSYPFVLSWSLLEAMSCGACVIGSDTEPVKEVIKHSHNGLIVPFEDHEKLSETIVQVIKGDLDVKQIRENARKSILENYSLNECIQRQLSLIDAIQHKAIAGE